MNPVNINFTREKWDLCHFFAVPPVWQAVGSFPPRNSGMPRAVLNVAFGACARATHRFARSADKRNGNFHQTLAFTPMSGSIWTMNQGLKRKGGEHLFALRCPWHGYQRCMGTLWIFFHCRTVTTVPPIRRKSPGEKSCSYFLKGTFLFVSLA